MHHIIMSIIADQVFFWMYASLKIRILLDHEIIFNAFNESIENTNTCFNRGKVNYVIIYAK